MENVSYSQGNQFIFIREKVRESAEFWKLMSVADNHGFFLEDHCLLPTAETLVMFYCL